MPVRIASLTSSSFPSFMSVYENDEEVIEKDAIQAEMPIRRITDLQSSQGNTDPQSRPDYALLPWLQHHGSISSFATASTESSPTAINYTFDSPILTDSTPSSSPESATSMLPLSTFGGDMSQSSNAKTHDSVDRRLGDELDVPVRSDSPGAASRNIKKLSLNTGALSLVRPATSSGADSSQPFSAPTSPFKEPLRTGRKKPANLTIWTPGIQKTFAPFPAVEVPPTPSFRPGLQQVQSSPHLGSLPSPPSRLSAGLNLSLSSLLQSHSGPGSDSSIATQSVQGILPGLREEEEIQPPKSQETQEKGYPDGPVLIYESGLYLYLEPTAEEASKFDTVINVAKEVKTPFDSHPTPNTTIASIWRNQADPAPTPEPQTAMSEMSFKSAWEWPREEDLGTPTTPKATRHNQKSKTPEYLHVPWDHNSEILDDLYPLCRLIDERIQAGRKVLIHCQLGVSRSASLVIAYGLYKGYHPDFHSMYMAVKQQSQWVGPNMSLIYQLTDFKSKLSNGEYTNDTRTAPQSWFKTTSCTTMSASPAETSSIVPQPAKHDQHDVHSNGIAAETPRTARPQLPLRLDKELPPIPLFPRDEPSNSIIPLPAAESSIKPSESVLPLRIRPGQPVNFSRNRLSEKLPASRPLPLREASGYKNIATIPPHRPKVETLPGLALNQPASKMDLAMQDVPETPSLLSPRATEFTASPFGINSVGDLEAFGLGLKKPVIAFGRESYPIQQPEVQNDSNTLGTRSDPRSPHQPSEHGQIIRNIDEFL